MKRSLLILGIIAIIAGVLSLLIAALYWYSYYHVLDGSSTLYSRLSMRKIVFLIAGICLVAAGIICLLIRRA
ncbi:MAG: hypothetical protein K6G81_00885 [Lachnospiraceae bacterium]|nr:hypothetical protein [Lachnospiraceae bacterium]